MTGDKAARVTPSERKKRWQRLLGVRQLPLELPHTTHPPGPTPHHSSLPKLGVGRGTLLLHRALPAARQDRAAKGRVQILAGGVGLSPGLGWPGAPREAEVTVG